MKAAEDVVLGIDIGGSHITLALVDLTAKKIVDQSYYRIHVNSWSESEGLITSWAEAIEGVCQKAGIAIPRIGIAMPGPFDYDKGISYIRGNNKYDSLYGLNMKELLADKLNIDAENIRMLNDAAAFLRGEVFAGTGKTYERAIGLTLGTGLGTAVYNNGIAKDGELWDSRFKEGIAEDYISTRWFVKRYFELSGINILDVKALKDIASQSDSAKAVFKEFAHNLGLFITSFAAAESPEVVILGGNITNASPLFLSHLLKFLSQHQVDIPVVISKLGENAAIMGAASCWQTELEQHLA
jgi:glucokinase